MECPDPEDTVELSPETPDTFDVEPIANQAPLLDERCRRIPARRNNLVIVPNFPAPFTLMVLRLRVISVRRITITVISRVNGGFVVRRITVRYFSLFDCYFSLFHCYFSLFIRYLSLFVFSFLSFVVLIIHFVDFHCRHVILIFSLFIFYFHHYIAIFHELLSLTLSLSFSPGDSHPS